MSSSSSSNCDAYITAMHTSKKLKQGNKIEKTATTNNFLINHPQVHSNVIHDSTKVRFLYVHFRFDLEHCF